MRGGSKGLPGKNLAEVGGRTLIARAVEAAAAAANVDLVVVSSDDPAMLAEGARAGAQALERPAVLAADDTPSEPVALHALSGREEVERLVLVQATSPLRIAEDVERCVAALDTAPAAATVAPSEHPVEWSVRIGADGRIEPVLGWEGFARRRQELAAGFRLNGAVYAARADHLRAGRPLVGPETAAVEMPGARSVDIDTEADLAHARLLAGS